MYYYYYFYYLKPYKGIRGSIPQVPFLSSLSWTCPSQSSVVPFLPRDSWPSSHHPTPLWASFVSCVGYFWSVVFFVCSDPFYSRWLRASQVGRYATPRFRFTTPTTGKRRIWSLLLRQSQTRPRSTLNCLSLTDLPLVYLGSLAGLIPACSCSIRHGGGAGYYNYTHHNDMSCTTFLFELGSNSGSPMLDIIVSTFPRLIYFTCQAQLPFYCCMRHYHVMSHVVYGFFQNTIYQFKGRFTSSPHSLS